MTAPTISDEDVRNAFAKIAQALGIDSGRVLPSDLISAFDAMRSVLVSAQEQERERCVRILDGQTKLNLACNQPGDAKEARRLANLLRSGDA